MQKFQTILVVDDTDANIDILVELLSEYDVLVATDGQGAIEIANEEKVDLILLDVMMPFMDGFETCQILKSKQQTKDIPIIFITAKTDEDSIEHAYDIGGIDYVTKPFKPKELIARVKTHLQTRELIENLEYISSHDSMTGLRNRRYFMEFADGFIKHSIRQNQPLSLMMIDIDKFKHINDTYGHNVGDIVIKHISDAFRYTIRESDVVARMGGEEFVILLPNTGEENAIFLAEKMRKTVEANKVELDKETIVATISVGVCELNVEAKPYLETLLKCADEALYMAKNSGRNQVISLKKRDAMKQQNSKPIFEWALSNGDANIVERIISKLLPELLRHGLKLTKETIASSESIEVTNELFELIHRTAEELVGSSYKIEEK